jgi:hypothetical protein
MSEGAAGSAAVAPVGRPGDAVPADPLQRLAVTVRFCRESADGSEATWGNGM